MVHKQPAVPALAVMCASHVSSSNNYTVHPPLPLCPQTLSSCPGWSQASFVGSLWAAAVIFGARLGAIYLGSWLGCWMGAAPSDARKHLWMGMVTQASRLSWAASGAPA